MDVVDLTEEQVQTERVSHKRCSEKQHVQSEQVQSEQVPEKLIKKIKAEAPSTKISMTVTTTIEVEMPALENWNEQQEEEEEVKEAFPLTSFPREILGQILGYVLEDPEMSYGPHQKKSFFRLLLVSKDFMRSMLWNLSQDYGLFHLLVKKIGAFKDILGKNFEIGFFTKSIQVNWVGAEIDRFITASEKYPDSIKSIGHRIGTLGFQLSKCNVENLKKLPKLLTLLPNVNTLEFSGLEVNFDSKHKSICEAIKQLDLSKFTNIKTVKNSNPEFFVGLLGSLPNLENLTTIPTLTDFHSGVDSTCHKPSPLGLLFPKLKHISFILPGCQFYGNIGKEKEILNFWKTHFSAKATLPNLETLQVKRHIQTFYPDTETREFVFNFDFQDLPENLILGENVVIKTMATKSDDEQKTDKVKQLTAHLFSTSFKLLSPKSVFVPEKGSSDDFLQWASESNFKFDYEQSDPTDYY